MADLNAVKQVLISTQAIERVQEAARRLGEHQQQGFAASLNQQVEKKEHQVTRTEESREETLDPDAKKKKEEEERRRRGEKAGGEDPEGPVSDDEDRGRHVDVRA